MTINLCYVFIFTIILNIMSGIEGKGYINTCFTYLNVLNETHFAVRNLYSGETVNVIPGPSAKMEIFCYDGRPKSVIHIWQSVHVSYNVIVS